VENPQEQVTPPAEAEPECPFQLYDLTRDQRIVWDWAYKTGYLHGHEAGWTAADAHANFLTRRAAEIVHSMATVDEIDEDEQARLRVAQDEQRRRLGWVS
jgi:hypothetical protein